MKRPDRRDSDRITLRELVRMFGFAAGLVWRADRWRAAGLLSVQLVASAGLGLVVLLTRDVFGAVLAGGGTRIPAPTAMIPVFAGLVTVGSVTALLRIAGHGWQQVLAVKVDRHIIGTVLAASCRAELADFERPEFHDRLQRAMYAYRAQPLVLVGSLLTAGQAVLSTLAVAGAFAVLAWWLLPLCLVAMAPVIRTAREERDARFGLHRRLAEQRRRRSYLESLLTGRDDAKEVRALDLGGPLRDRWHALYQVELDRTGELQRFHTRRKLIARLFAQAVTIAVIGAVWWMVSVHGLNLAGALAALTALWLLTGRVQALGYLLNGIGETASYLRDLREFGVSAGPAPEPGPPVAVGAGPPRCLRAERIGFRYPGSTRPVLQDVSVTLRSGEVVAVVGRNGSGKTTLAKILAGLYPPQTGRLVRDDRPDPDRAALRADTAVVFQDFARFKLTAAENIALGRADRPADGGRIEQAARQLAADGFLRRLPDGYQTVLSKEFSGGTDLSLGQWQRLALARACYRDAPFVILDEPTASLDPQAEAELFAGIRSLFAGRMVLLISHRFASVRNADRIYVLDEGRVTESGTHDSLLASGGGYARLFELQARQYHGIRDYGTKV